MESLELVRPSYRNAMRSDKLNRLEKEVILKLLSGDHPAVRVLREQLEHCRVRSREMTGTGFVTELDVPREIDRAKVEKMRLGNVVADVEGLKNGAGFLLYVKGGALDAIEGYSFEEPWPETITWFQLRYLSENE
jgi:hypothetical protein